MMTFKEFLEEGDVVRTKFATKLSHKKGITWPRHHWSAEKGKGMFGYMAKYVIKDDDHMTHHHDGVEIHHGDGSTTFVKNGHHPLNGLDYTGPEPYISKKTGPRPVVHKGNVVKLRR